MTRAKTLFRRLRSIFWTALTLLTLLAAILVGVGKLVMPYSDRYQPQLEEWLSGEFGQQVRIESFTGEWKAFGPRISLQGVNFLAPGSDEGEIAFQKAALDIKPLNALLPGRPLYTFQIIGADLSLAHLPDGRWELSGLGVSGRNGQGGSGTRVLAIVGELRLEDSRLSFDDPAREISAQFTQVKGRLQLDGSEIAAEIQANVTSGGRGRILGDLKATLLMTLDEDQKLVSAQWHAKTRELMIAELVRQVPSHPLIPQDGWLNAEVWGDWARDSGQTMEGVVDLRDSHLAGEPEPLRVDHMNARFHWSFLERKSWRLDFSEFEIEQNGEVWGTDRLSVERNIPGNLGLWVSADSLEVEFPLSLTQRIMSVYKTAWPRNVPKQASGEVRAFDLILDRRWKLYMARGAFDGARAWDWDRWPDVTGISGQADLLAGEGQVEFSGQAVEVEWPRNFRRPLVVDIPSCTLEIGWGSTWQADTRECTLRNASLEASGRLRFAKSEGKPVVDINAIVHRADVAGLRDYWPREVLKPAVSDWLSQGLAGGEVVAGRFMLNGDMDDWPFTGGEGQLEATADFRGMELDYYPGWPRGNGLDGSAHFLGAAMTVNTSAASLAGVPVRQVTGEIRNFQAPVLELEFATDLTLPGLLGYIRETPLLDNANIDPDQFLLEGAASITGQLRVALKANGEPMTINGQLQLPGNGFTELRSSFHLDNITGSLEFDRNGLSARELAARYRGHDTRVLVEAGWAKQASFRSELQGNLPVLELIPVPVLESEGLLQAVSGNSDITATLIIEPTLGETPSEIWLDVTSTLVGATIDHPAPLFKPAEAEWPLHVRYPVRAADPVCRIEVPGRLSMAFDLPDGFQSIQRAYVHVGEGDASLPEPGQLRITGQAGDLDFDGWVQSLTQRFSEQQALGSLELQPVTLSARSLHLLGRDFNDVDMQIVYTSDLISGTFDSEALAGEIRYSHSEDGSHSLTAQLETLHLPPPAEDEPDLQTDPSLLPEMHIYIENFRYLGLDLGETRIEAYPRQEGFRFASVEANSPDFTLNARGDWVRDDNGERSDFDVVMTSESLGSLMEALDISSVLEGGQTMVRYDAWWPGPPAAFALARLNGDINFSVIQGTIINADAGAGRMVGLMSIAALPRRLAFDFRDVFGTGFNFDEAAGTLTLENGNAYTDDLVLTSTAATMEIAGSSHLEEQTFDYILSIKPGVGQALPVLGALAGGPGGAAAGLALQGLLQKSLGEAAEARYSITGSWTDPRVVRIPMEPEAERAPGNE